MNFTRFRLPGECEQLLLGLHETADYIAPDKWSPSSPYLKSGPIAYQILGPWGHVSCIQDIRPSATSAT